MRIKGFSRYDYDLENNIIYSYANQHKIPKRLLFQSSASLIADDNNTKYTFLLPKLRFAVKNNLDPRDIHGVIREGKLMSLSESAIVSSKKKLFRGNGVESDYYKELQNRIDFLNIQKELHEKGNIEPYLKIEQESREKAVLYLVHSYRIPKNIAEDIYDEVALDVLEDVLEKKLIISLPYLDYMKGKMRNKVYKAKNKLCNIKIKGYDF